jgi:hypothetical protein
MADPVEHDEQADSAEVLSAGLLLTPARPANAFE